MPVIQHDPLRRLCFDLFKTAGAPEADARIISDHLVDSNLNGHDSHGVSRAPLYVELMQQEYVGWDASRVQRETPIMVTIDGKQANGIVAMRNVVDLAVDKCRGSGVAVVGLHNVTHIGRVGDYPPRIAEHGMVAMVLTNVGGVFVAPFGSAEQKLPPNPLAMAVPRRNGSPLLLDTTLSVVAGGKIDQMRIKGEPLPDGWAVNPDGSYFHDSASWRGISTAAAVLPLGGLQFGHKGHALSMMMEMIVGPLTMGGTTKSSISGGGVLTIALDIEAFTNMDTFLDDVEAHVAYVNSAKPLPGVEKLYAPGEIEAEAYANRSRDGIYVADMTWDELTATASKLGVTVPN